MHVARWIGFESKRLDVCLLDEDGELVGRRGAAGRRGCAAWRGGRPGGAGARGDRVDDRGAVRARHAGGARLGGADRRRAEGQGAGAAGLQDRQDRRAGCWPSCRCAISCRRSGCPTRGCGASASRPASAASGQAQHDAEEPHPRDADHLRDPCPVTDLFGVAGRELLDRLEIPQPCGATLTPASG